MTSWCRYWNGAATDPKFLVVARRANAKPGEASALFAALIDHASQCPERGSVEGFDAETYAAFSGFDEAIVRGLLTAFAEKGMIAGGRLAAWDRRQPKREDDSRDRVKKHRERHRNDAKRDVTQGNAPEQSRAEQKETPLQGVSSATPQRRARPKAGADAAPVSQRVTTDDPRWTALAERYKAEKGRAPIPMFNGVGNRKGCEFPLVWIEEIAA